MAAVFAEEAGRAVGRRSQRRGARRSPPTTGPRTSWSAARTSGGRTGGGSVRVRESSRQAAAGFAGRAFAAHRACACPHSEGVRRREAVRAASHRHGVERDGRSRCHPMRRRAWITGLHTCVSRCASRSVDAGARRVSESVTTWKSGRTRFYSAWPPECVSAPDGNWLAVASSRAPQLGGSAREPPTPVCRRRHHRLGCGRWPRSGATRRAACSIRSGTSAYWLDIVGKAASDAATTRRRGAGGREGRACCRPARVRSISTQIPIRRSGDCLARITTAHAVRNAARSRALRSQRRESHARRRHDRRRASRATYRHLVQRWLERLVAAGLLVARAGAFDE